MACQTHQSIEIAAMGHKILAIEEIISVFFFAYLYRVAEDFAAPLSN